MTQEQGGAQDCTQAVIVLDQIGLYAMTEAVIDTNNYKNLLHLFLCVKLGPYDMANASMGQRRILNKIVNTLTSSKANLIVKDHLGVLMVESMPDMPIYLQKLIVQLLQKATRLADYKSLTFNWLVLLLKSQVADLVQTALSVLVSHSDPSKNSKWNQMRLDWINSCKINHLKIIEACCDVEHLLNHPDSFRTMATETIINFCKQSD